MGMIKSEINFDLSIPTAELVVETMTKLSGQPILIISSVQNDVYDVSINVAFTLFPETHLKIYGYRINNETVNNKTIYISCFAQESTLYYAAIQALELLGGLSRNRLSDSFRLTFPISESELKIRHNNHKYLMKKLGVKLLFLSPILIPYSILSFLYNISKMPSQVTM